ncbi:MAG: hypothetical protein MJ131_10565, partial [Lachnospiraceae bacterium]|nr:hypothetical protein [Lachnospiraceae bacterium]
VVYVHFDFSCKTCRFHLRQLNYRGFPLVILKSVALWFTTMRLFNLFGKADCVLGCNVCFLRGPSSLATFSYCRSLAIKNYARHAVQGRTARRTGGQGCPTGGVEHRYARLRQLENEKARPVLEGNIITAKDTDRPDVKKAASWRTTMRLILIGEC